MANDNDGFTLTYARWVIRQRWWVAMACIVMTLVAGYGGQFIVFDNDYRAFFSKANPQLTAFETLERIYTKNDSVLFVIRPDDGSVFSKRTLQALHEITEKAWQVPFSTRVDSLTNFQHTRADEDDLIVEDLVAEPEALLDADLVRVREVAMNEPVLLGRMISRDGTTTGINVRLQVPGLSLDELPQAANFARGIRDEIKSKYPELEIRLSGSAMLSNAFSEAPQKDLRTLIPAMYGILLVATFIFFRSIAGTLVTVIVVLMSVITAMGVAGWLESIRPTLDGIGLAGRLGGKLNGVSASAPQIILTLAIADSVHILVTMFAEMRRGSGKNDALVESLRVNAQPVFLTSLTTAIGFVSLNFGDAPPLWHLGNITSVGVLAAYLYSVTFLPAVVAILPIRVRESAGDENDYMARLAEFVIRRRVVLGWGMGAVVLVLGAAIPLFEINDRPIEYFDNRMEFRRDADYAIEHLTGIYAIGYSLGAGESSGINEPEYLERLEAFSNWLREKPEVAHVFTFADVMKRLNKNMHGDDPSYYRVPEGRELAAQYLLLYEMSLPYGLDVNDQVNVDKSATRLDATMADIDFKRLKEIKYESEDWLRENGLKSMEAEGAGTAVMFAYIGERNIYAMIRGTALAFTLISIVLVIALKSFRMGLVSLIPNIVPAIMAFGIWALLFRKVGFAISIVTSVSIGIIVDDTVHFLSKYLRARREQGLSSEDAVRYAFRTVGVALFVTSAILIVGFGALATSAFWPNATLGMLTALTITCALFADFLLLPSLLMAIDRKQRGRTVDERQQAA